MAAQEVVQDTNFSIIHETSESGTSALRRFTVAAATGGLALALAACNPGTENTESAPAVMITASPDATTEPSSEPSSSHAPEFPAPTEETNQYANCEKVKNDSPNVECVAKAKGLFGLRVRSKLIDADSAEIGETFQLTRKPGNYPATCDPVLVDYFPLPKDGTGKAYEVVSFNICDPNSAQRPIVNCPDIDPGYEYNPKPGSEVDPGYEYTPKSGGEIDPGYEIDPRDNCPVNLSH